jgi:hypothetical protein
VTIDANNNNNNNNNDNNDDDDNNNNNNNNIHTFGRHSAWLIYLTYQLSLGTGTGTEL